MKAVKCKCGEFLNRSTESAARVKTWSEEFYEWVCDKCGQVYRTKIKDPIYLHD